MPILAIYALLALVNFLGITGNINSTLGAAYISELLTPERLGEVPL